MKPSSLGAPGSKAGQQLDKELPGLEVLGIPPTSAKVSEVCARRACVQRACVECACAECARAAKPSSLGAPGSVAGQQLDKELPGLEVLGIPPTSTKVRVK